jgi:hypothetical protein
MLSRQPTPRSGARDEVDDRHGRLSSGHQPQLLGLIHDLLERDVQQRRDLELDDRAIPAERRAGGEAGEHLLGDRHVEHPIVEVGRQAFRDAAQRLANVLAEHEHLRVALHLVAQSLCEGLEVAHSSHDATPSRGLGPLA